MKKLLLGSAALFITSCSSKQMPWQTVEETPAIETAAETDTQAPTIADAEAFILAAEKELSELSEYASHVYWLQATNINYDSNWLVSKVGAEFTEAAVRLANATKAYEKLDLPADLARKMSILKAGITIPAPSTEGAAAELAKITTGLDSTYSTGTFEYKGETLNLTQLSNIIATSRDPDELAKV